jgi:hypothetical protein
MAGKWWEKYMSAAEWGNLSPGAKKGFEGMNKELKTARFQESSSLNVGDQVLSTTSDRAAILLKQFEESQKALRDLAGQGYGLDQDAPVIAGLNRAINLTDTFLGNAKEGARAMERLANSTPTNQFQTLSSVLGDATGELATNAATLNQLGLSYSQFSKNIDTMIYSFSQSEAGVKSINQQLFNFAKEVKQLPSVVSNNFQLVAQSLGYAFPMIQDQFVKIQQLSAKTGVSVQKLMGTFGQQTDTIAGASSFAANMNSLLGKNVFSATQVLMMDEADRMTATRDALRQSQVYRDYMSDDPKLKKFALRAMSNRLQMSPDETRRFLDETDGGEGQSLKSQMAKKVDDNFNQSADALTRSIGTLTQAIAGNADLIDYRRRTATNRDLAQMRRGTLLALTSNVASADGFSLRSSLRNENIAQFQTKYGDIAGADIGGSTREIGAAMVDAYRDGREHSSAVAMKLNEAFRMVAAEPLLDAGFKDMNIIDKIKNGEFKAANTALDDFLNKGRSGAMIPKHDTRITNIEADVLKRYQNEPHQMRRLMRKFRIGDYGTDTDLKTEVDELDERRRLRNKKERTKDEQRKLDDLDSKYSAAPVETRSSRSTVEETQVVLNIYTTNGDALVKGLSGRMAETFLGHV